MAIRVVGANPRNYTAEKILQVAIDKRYRDKVYDIPLQVIHLDWSTGKRNYHQAKTKGDWDDVFIERIPSGGITVRYRNPGSLEWIKDGLSGDYSALCAVTEKNLFLLASHYYDRLWTIRDSIIEKKAKVRADEIDEENKKIPYKFRKIFKKINPETGMYETVEEEIDGTMYDFHVQRREAQFSDHNEKLSISPMGVNEQSNIDTEKIDIARQKRELKEREDAVAEREKAAGITFDISGDETMPEMSDKTPGYQEEELNKMHISTLRKLAKDKFGIEDAFKITKKQIIPQIMQIQFDSNKDTVTEEGLPSNVRDDIVQETESVVN